MHKQTPSLKVTEGLLLVNMKNIFSLKGQQNQNQKDLAGRGNHLSSPYKEGQYWKAKAVLDVYKQSWIYKSPWGSGTSVGIHGTTASVLQNQGQEMIPRQRRDGRRRGKYKGRAVSVIHSGSWSSEALGNSNDNINESDHEYHLKFSIRAFYINPLQYFFSNLCDFIYNDRQKITSQKSLLTGVGKLLEAVHSFNKYVLNVCPTLNSEFGTGIIWIIKT